MRRLISRSEEAESLARQEQSRASFVEFYAKGIPGPVSSLSILPCCLYYFGVSIAQYSACILIIFGHTCPAYTLHIQASMYITERQLKTLVPTLALLQSQARDEDCLAVGHLSLPALTSLRGKMFNDRFQTG